jgi:hypothetical protein
MVHIRGIRLVASTYPLAYSSAWFDDATVDFDATEHVPADTRAP